jgi:signal transduction histidine kinase
VDLVGTVRTLADESSLDVELCVPEELLVGQGCAGAARSVIREALTNATRHGTGSASLRLRADERSVRIELRNPISGGNPAVRERAGLNGLYERVLLAGGELTAGPDGGDSWLLTARLPVGTAPTR